MHLIHLNIKGEGYAPNPPEHQGRDMPLIHLNIKGGYAPNPPNAPSSTPYPSRCRYRDGPDQGRSCRRGYLDAGGSHSAKRRV